MMDDELRQRIRRVVKRNFSLDKLHAFKREVGKEYTEFIQKDMLKAGFVTFDIVKFDEYVKDSLEIGDYEKEGKSLKQVVKENYGEKVYSIIVKSCFLNEII